jgi:hypothetical protein
MAPMTADKNKQREVLQYPSNLRGINSPIDVQSCASDETIVFGGKKPHCAGDICRSACAAKRDLLDRGLGARGGGVGVMKTRAEN